MIRMRLTFQTSISITIIKFILLMNHLSLGSIQLSQDDLSELANQVAARYFKGSTRCVVVVTERGLLDKFIADKLTTVRVSSSDDSAGCDEDLQFDLEVAFREKCRWYIVQISNPKCFLSAWDKALYSSFHNHQPRLIFLPRRLEPFEYVEALLSDRLTETPSNILLAEIVSDPNWPVIMYTNNFNVPVGEPERVGKVFLDKWSPSNGFQSGIDLFPDKIVNLENKVMRLSTIQYPSYAIVEPRLDGSEVRILLTFCELYNCSVTRTYFGDHWGHIYPSNNTGEGEIGIIYQDEADFGVAANYLWYEFYQYLTFSDPYLVGSLTVLVPKEKIIGGWKTPYLPFEPDMWIGFVVCLGLSAFTLYSATFLTMKYAPTFKEKIKQKGQFTTATDSFIRSLGMAVLQQPFHLIQVTPVRLLFTSFEFVYFILSSMYAAELASHLTVPNYIMPIDSVREMVEQDLKWFGPDAVWLYGIAKDEDPHIKKFVSNFKEVSHEDLMRIGPMGVYGIAIEKMPAGYMTQVPYITEETISVSHIMKESFTTSPLVACLRKGSPYTDKINALIGRILSSGLMYYWEGRVTRTYANYSIQQAYQYARKIHFDNAPEKLNTSHIVGIFILYAVGITLAVTFFIGELLVASFTRKSIFLPNEKTN